MQWLSFVIWLAYGLYVWRKRDRVLGWARSKSAGVRLPLSIGFLFGGAAVLLCGLLAIDQTGGLKQVWAWPAIVAIGIVFVHCQVMAVVLAVSNVLFGDTSNLKQSSNTEEEVEKP